MNAAELDLGRRALERGLFRDLDTIPVPGPWAAGRAIAGFEIRGILGRGAMGSVYRAWHPGLGKEIALKVLEDAGQGAPRQQRFLVEAQAAGRLSHANIVGVLDAKIEGGTGIIVMDIVEGPTLEELLDRHALPLRTGVALVEKIARAIAYAHGRGVVHRDIKPSNILVDASGEPKLVDFGLARLSGLQIKLTKTGASMGTPAYMPPEQVRGAVREIGPHSDIYSLGVVLYRLLAGRVPFDGSTLAEVYDRILRSDPLPPRRIVAGCPVDLETICLKALEKQPSRRYADAAALAEDLRRWLAGEPIGARPIGTATKVWRRTERHRRTIATLAVAGFLLAAGLGWSQRDYSRRTADKAEALRRLEVARPVIERASHGFYREDADFAKFRAAVAEVRGPLEGAVALDPTLTAGHYLLGRAWQMTGSIDRAEACWRRAIDLEPGFGPAHYQLARLLIVRSFIIGDLGHGPRNRGNAVEAKRLIAECIRELELASAAGSGFDDDLQREIARAFVPFLQGRLQEAFGICDAAIRRFGRVEGAETLYWMAGLILTGEGRLDAYTKALSIRPKDPLLLMCRAMAYTEVECHRADAVRDCSTAINVDPTFAGAWFQRGSVLALLNDHEGAARDYAEFIRLEPTTEAGYVGLGRAHGNLERWAEAARDLAEALRLYPDDDTALLLHAQAMYYDGKVKEAIAELDALLSTNPGNQDARLTRAQGRMQIEDFAASVADYDEFLRRDGARFEIRPERGQVLSLLGRPEEAIADYRAALAGAPEDWPARDCVERMIEDAKAKIAGY